MSAREQALLDRIEQLETLLSVDRSATGQLREVFKLEPLHAQMLGMLLKREFVTRDGLYTVLYEGRPECEWPDEKILDVQMCKMRAHLKKHGHDITIITKWGEGWQLSKADKAKISDAVSRGPLDDLPVIADAPPLAPAGSAAAAPRERRMAFLEGA